MLQQGIVVFDDWLLPAGLGPFRNFRGLEQRVVDGRLVVLVQLGPRGRLLLGGLLFLSGFFDDAFGRPLGGGLGLQPADVLWLVFGVDEGAGAETLAPAVQEGVELADGSLLPEPNLGVHRFFNHHFLHLALLDHSRYCRPRLLRRGERFEGPVLGRRVEGHRFGLLDDWRGRSRVYFADGWAVRLLGS